MSVFEYPLPRFERPDTIRPPGFRPDVEFSPHGLTIIQVHDFLKVERMMREVTLWKEIILGFHPYRHSRISLEEVNLDRLWPCALYILEPQLEVAKELREVFLKQGLDPLRLTVEQTMIDYNWGKQRGCRISPPIVEVSQDDERKLIIVDGLHRVTLAQKLGLKITNVILVENTAAPLSVLPVGWDEIRICESVPPTEEKRRFRFNSEGEIWQWISKNYDRYLQGFDFPEKLGWMHVATL